MPPCDDTSPTPQSQLPAPPSLRHHRAFTVYLAYQVSNLTGSAISYVALPTLAVAELDASGSQVARLAFLEPLLTVHPAHDDAPSPGGVRALLKQHPRLDFDCSPRTSPATEAR